MCFDRFKPMMIASTLNFRDTSKIVSLIGRPDSNSTWNSGSTSNTMSRVSSSSWRRAVLRAFSRSDSTSSAVHQDGGFGNVILLTGTTLSKTSFGSELIGRGNSVRESELGYKMVKWIEHNEFIQSEKLLGAGEGGKNEDDEYFDLLPNI